MGSGKVCVRGLVLPGNQCTFEDYTSIKSNQKSGNGSIFSDREHFN